MPNTTDNDPITENNTTVNKVIARFKNNKLISSNALDKLEVESPRTPSSYIQPKTDRERNLGRTVISCLNCHFSKLSEYIDFYLRTIVKQIPSYVKDTTDFLRKIEAKKSESVPDNAYLVPLDIKSLYTSIPN